MSNNTYNYMNEHCVKEVIDKYSKSPKLNVDDIYNSGAGINMFDYLNIMRNITLLNTVKEYEERWKRRNNQYRTYSTNIKYVSNGYDGIFR